MNEELHILEKKSNLKIYVSYQEIKNQLVASECIKSNIMVMV
jgi:hypothetical protein